jgi:signal transduction histidine kinase
MGYFRTLKGKLLLFANIGLVFTITAILGALVYSSTQQAKVVEEGLWKETSLSSKELARAVWGQIDILAKSNELDKNLETLKKNLENLKVGKTGYVYIIDKDYVLVAHPKAEGKNIGQAKDPDGNFVIQDMVKKAKENHGNQANIFRYKWKNPGEAFSRDKFAALAYYAPLGWTIGVSAYNDDFMDTFYNIDEKLTNFSIFVMCIAVIGLLISIFIVYLFGTKLSKYIQEVVTKLVRMAKGDLRFADSEKKEFELMLKNAGNEEVEQMASALLGMAEFFIE